MRIFLGGQDGVFVRMAMASRPRSGVGWLAASGALHAAVIGGTLLRWPVLPVSLPPPEPIAIQVIPDPVMNDPGRTAGAPQADPTPPSASAAPPEPALPEGPGDAPMPTPTQAEAAPAPASAPAAVRLGDADEDGETDLVRGPAVGPAPDPKHRNIPPRFPLGAARRGEGGLVRLAVRVGVSGAVTEVGVEGSSGYADLDQAAREAVEKWRFAPARAGTGEAMEAMLPVSFEFDPTDPTGRPPPRLDLPP